MSLLRSSFCFLFCIFCFCLFIILFFFSGEDEDWDSDEAKNPPSEEPKTSTPSPQEPKPTSPTPEPVQPAPDETPKLRLNASLATDPALRPTEGLRAELRPEIRSPAETGTPEYLAGLSQGGLSPAALLAAGRYFPLLAPIPTEVVTRPPSEGDRPVGTVPVYMCTPCGIR